jgi:hypothetical protein
MMVLVMAEGVARKKVKGKRKKEEGRRKKGRVLSDFEVARVCFGRVSRGFDGVRRAVLGRRPPQNPHIPPHE